MGSGKVWLGVLTGVAISAVTGILLTAGKRRRISLKGNSQQELAAEVNHLILNITRRFEAMKEETNRVTEKAVAAKRFSTRTKLDSL